MDENLLVSEAVIHEPCRNGDEFVSEWNNPGFITQPVTTVTWFFLLLFLPK